MYCDEEKLDNFLNKFSNPVKVFREVCNKEKNKVRKEIENYKKETEKMEKDLVKEAKLLFEQNNTNFKRVKIFQGISIKLNC